MDKEQLELSRQHIWILAVDDEGPLRRLVARMLEQSGYNCVTASSCKEARDILKTRPFDLVLVDLKMPDESGLSLIQHVKENHPETARVMLTATTDPDLAREIMDVGVYGYIIKPVTRDMLIITVENALRHHFLAIQMKAYKGQLEEKAWSRKEKLGVIMENLSIGVAMIGPDMKLLEMNQQMRTWFPNAPREGGDCYHLRLSPGITPACKHCPLREALFKGKNGKGVRQLYTAEGKKDFSMLTSPVRDKAGNIIAAVELLEDVTERLTSEREASKRQKLEAVGQLASGIVHEINTPVQYVMDNMNFLQDSFTDLSDLLDEHEKLFTSIISSGTVNVEELQKAIDEAREDADLDYLLEELPKTLEQSLEGIQRINAIVRAMKEFSHPGSDEKSLVDINVLLENAITISKNEWKYVADIETNFDKDLPQVSCLASEMNQVFLNLIVNAAHAIGSLTEQGIKGRGLITISSERLRDNVRIMIKDTGGGVPEEFREKIFEPFFTTKARGEGTGQGLAIARRVVEEKHSGTLGLLTTPGEGTMFTIELPII